MQADVVREALTGQVRLADWARIAVHVRGDEAVFLRLRLFEEELMYSFTGLRVHEPLEGRGFPQLNY
jgi:hypothetical protein